MKWLAFIVAVFTQAAATAQSTVAEFTNSGFEIPFSDARSLDLDGDANADFTFGNDGMLCTADVPTSSCSTYYVIVPAAGNSYLTNGSTLAVLSLGTVIGPTTPGTSWSTSPFGKTLFGYTKNMRDPAADLHFIGPFSPSTDGFLGVRFQKGDGVHYGWIRVKVQGEEGPAPYTPRVIEWAYETRPGEPISAGAKPILASLVAGHSPRRGFMRLSWSSDIGKAYQLQTKSFLNAHPWTNLNFTLVATGDTTTVELPTGNGAAFYRVVEESCCEPSLPQPSTGNNSPQ